MACRPTRRDPPPYRHRLIELLCDDVAVMGDDELVLMKRHNRYWIRDSEFVQ